MRPWSKALCISLVLAFGFNTGYGWGSVTHVFFSKHLGTKFGTLNQNEMYGSVVLDLLGYEFTDMSALTADYVLHTDKDVLWAFYAGANSPEARAFAYGCFTHSNSTDIKGADWYAHGVYPGSEEGWVIRQGVVLASNRRVSNYLESLVGSTNLEEFSVVVGHTLIETAVDILIKRYDDPLVGGRLYLAAKNRTDEVPGLLQGVLGGAYPAISDRELAYREQMMTYGQLFLLREAQLLPILSEQIAGLARAYTAAMYGIDKEVDAGKVSEFIGLAIRQVAPCYRREILATLLKVGVNMKLNAPPPAGPLFALFGSDNSESELDGTGMVSGTVPETFALEQNYPNPFNPSTRISYALPVDAQVTLKVYNSIGQEVAILVDEFKPAGIHQQVWEARALPSGLYIYRLTAGSYTETRKMTLMK